MRPAEEGLLLLCCALGTQDVPLTPAQYRTLARRVRQTCQAGDGEVTPAYLRALGYPEAAALQITALLDRTDTLHRYLEAAAAQGITVLTRLSDGFPARLRRMGETECPPALFCRGDTALLGTRSGADTAAQEACLAAGGRVICFVPDSLLDHPARQNVLYCSAGGYELPFSTPRALARNCLIHAMGEKTLVAQCAEGTGGTWSGSQWNLRRGMSELYVFDDGSAASAALQSCGAERLPDIPASLALLRPFQLSIFDGKSDEKRKK